ncbi:hypothetical protein IVB12_15430 [Bradyrhizobium sp. 179]|uniref:hypothetical protein n=1 Tax=Bradyrhizobium sp. 179 TaxID=2782648 RepID=UPI001FF7C0E7|nr:hypothetical protein [Bradyrhizobium sp. 179]MCK1543306.1 hypothetical protein [Bradyrhizobium sp. 179]
MSDTDTTTPAPAPKPTPRIAVKNFIDGTQARKDASFSLADLSSAFQDQMSFRIHYGELKAQAERQVADLKLKLEAAESKVGREIRDDLTKQGVKVTEKLLEQEMNAHRTILAIKLAINEAKQVFEVAKAVYEAFDDRQKMLMSAGAKDRVEMEGDIRMGVAAVRDTAIKTGAADMLEKRRQLLAGNAA